MSPGGWEPGLEPGAAGLCLLAEVPSIPSGPETPALSLPWGPALAGEELRPNVGRLSPSSMAREGKPSLYRTVPGPTGKAKAVTPRAGGSNPGSRPGSPLPRRAALGQSLNLSVFPS